jgi:hypothetical protein
MINTRRVTRVAGACGIAVLLATGAAACFPTGTDHGGHGGAFTPTADAFKGRSDKPVAGNVLDNDGTASAVVASTTPTNGGTVVVNPDGSFVYTPAAGFTGTDTFTYTTTDAVELFPTVDGNGKPLPDLAAVEGPNGTTTHISAEAYGSAFSAVPGKDGWFYGLTDRGPNADAPDGRKSEMVLDFVPQVGVFHLVGGQMRRVDTITLKGPEALGGHDYSGLPPHDTPEIIDDVNATNTTGVITPVPRDPNGYDSEGLAVMPDGTFWVSDEYGPYITHFDRKGYEIGRLTPYTNGPDDASHVILGHLPAELATRVTNKGMEGLTITPDGKTLVGIMQSALGNASNVLTRVVVVDLATYTTKQYAYLLDTPGTASDANSEITAISNTQFLVDERDGNANGGDKKTIYRIDIAGATDLTNQTPGGKTPEAFVGNGTSATAAADLLSAASITPVAKAPYVQVGALAAQLDPTGHFYLHDKVEGVATNDGGRTLYISNDSDFGIDRIVGPDGSVIPAPFSPPWRVHQKAFALTGLPDRGVILKVDTTKLTSPGSASTQTVTVTITIK